VQPFVSSLPYMPPLLGVPLFYLIEIGMTVPLIVCLLLWGHTKRKLGKIAQPLIFLSVLAWLPLIVSRLVQSGFNNDFGLRIPLLYSVFASLLLVVLLDNVTVPRKVYHIVLSLLLLSVAVGAAGGILEIYYRTTGIEAYHPLHARPYRVITKLTSPTDIIISNESYFTDRIAVFSSRMALNTQIPFSMDVYIKQATKYRGGKYYQQELCQLYTHVKRSRLPYTVVYAELQVSPKLHCPELQRRIAKHPPLFSSGTVTLYRVE
jgi:hypothetical protein